MTAPNDLLFQTDGQWWFVWTPKDDPITFEDAYTTADDMSDVDANQPRTAILLDVFARLNDGKPFPFTVINRSVRICCDGWPCEGGKLASGHCTRCAPGTRAADPITGQQPQEGKIQP